MLIQTHPEDLLRPIASRCVGAPWVGLSRAGGGCGPREPVGVSLPCVHAQEMTQNSPRHRLSRSCIAKRSKTVVEQWQIPRFVPGRESQGKPGARASRLERSRLLRGMWGWFSITSMPRRASAARRPAALWATDSEQRRFPSRRVLLEDAVAMRCVHDCRSQQCAP